MPRSCAAPRPSRSCSTADAYQFPQAISAQDETGCYAHGNVTHHQAMGALVAAEIKDKLGW
jgi:hypothetical protein